MKNKNIISLTIFAVVLGAAGMLGLSKFFENAWQRESTVDNNLNAEIINNSKSVFNYPYARYVEMEKEDKQKYDLYYEEGVNYYVTPRNNEFGYQDAVNVFGETIKYLTGGTSHQKSATIVELEEYSRFGMDTANYKIAYIENNTGFKMYIDDYSKEITSLFIDDLENYSTHYISNQITVIDTPAEKEKLMNSAFQYANELGIDKIIIAYRLEKLLRMDPSGETDIVNTVLLMTDDNRYLRFRMDDEYSFISYDEGNFSYARVSDYIYFIEGIAL